jgi:hypothetical protein
MLGEFAVDCNAIHVTAVYITIVTETVIRSGGQMRRRITHISLTSWLTDGGEVVSLTRSPTSSMVFQVNTLPCRFGNCKSYIPHVQENKVCLTNFNNALVWRKFEQWIGVLHELSVAEHQSYRITVMLGPVARLRPRSSFLPGVCLFSATAQHICCVLCLGAVIIFRGK